MSVMAVKPQTLHGKNASYCIDIYGYWYPAILYVFAGLNCKIRIRFSLRTPKVNIFKIGLEFLSIALSLARLYLVVSE